MTTDNIPAPVPGSSRPTVIALLSGGLDSALVIKLMVDQGLNVLALNFTSPFCTCTSHKEGGCMLAARDADENARLEQLAGPLPVLSFATLPGPTAVLRGSYTEQDLVTIGRLLRHFAHKVTAETVEILLQHAGQSTTLIAHDAATANEVETWAI